VNAETITSTRISGRCDSLPVPASGTTAGSSKMNKNAKWSNPKFDDILAKMDKELDVEKRKALAKEGEDLLDQEAPMFMHGWPTVPRIWRKHVKGINQDIVGSYICLRYDTIWLDK